MKAGKDGDVSWLTQLPLLTAAQRREVTAVFRRALVESPLPTTLVGMDGRILGCNAQFERMMGVDEAALHGLRIRELVHPEDVHKSAAVSARLRSGRSTLENYEARWVRPDGQVVWTRRHVMRVDGPAQDDRAYVVGVMEDLTPKRLAQALASALVDIGAGIAAGAPLEETAQRLTALTEARWVSAGCVLTVLDRERNVLRPVSPGVVGQGFLSEVGDIPVGPAGCPSGIAAWRNEPTAIPDLLTDERAKPLRPVLSRHDVVSSWAVPLHNVEGKVIGTLGLYHGHRHEPSEQDWRALASVAGVAAIAVVAEQRRQAASRERQRVRTDPRMGLLNDVALMEHVDTMLSRGEPVTVAVATLRGPRHVASLDSLSRTALTILAERAQALGQVPHVAATGVTSLVLVVRARWDEREARLLHRVLGRPIDIGTTVVRPEVALGVAVSPAPSGANAAELLARATLAVPSRSGCRVVQPEPPEAVQDHGLVADVARGFRQGEFLAYYQPQFDLITGDAIGSEALVRWQHPERGVLDPAEFLPLIESTGVSTELAFAMVQRVTAEEQQRLRAGLRGHVAVNVTADDLLNESFLEVLRDPEERLWRQISLELTEAQFVRPEAVATLEELAALGYHVALDDFGTGYSALSAIHTLPVSIVKIDQSFVGRLPRDASAEALIAAMTALCGQLGIAVIAEGVETAEQAHALRDLGCRIGQGFLFGGPQPLDAFTGEPLWQDDSLSRRRRAKWTVNDAARRRMLELHEQGASAASIAAALNRSGYRAGGGTRWHARSVLQVLSREGRLPA